MKLITRIKAKFERWKRDTFWQFVTEYYIDKFLKPQAMEKLRASRFITVEKQIIEPPIMNQCGEVMATLDFYTSLSKTPNKWFCRIPIELPEQDIPIRGITITYSY